MTYCKKLSLPRAITCEKFSDSKQSNIEFLTKTIILKLLFCIFFFNLPRTFLPSNFTVQALFSPGGHITQELVKRISAAKKSIWGAVYTFTDHSIAQALVDARGRGVEIKIILDKMSVESQWTKTKLLLCGGVDLFCKMPEKSVAQTKELTFPVVEPDFEKYSQDHVSPRGFFNFSPIMHHKYAIFDSYTVWTGSFNWTLSANSKNNENVVIIDGNLDLVAAFAQNFQTVLASCRAVGMETVDAVLEKNKVQKQLQLDKRRLVALHKKEQREINNPVVKAVKKSRKRKTTPTIFASRGSERQAATLFSVESILRYALHFPYG